MRKSLAPDAAARPSVARQAGVWYLSSMGSTLRGHVQDGKLVVDDPIDLPNGTHVQLALVDEGDDLDDEDRARLHAAIETSRLELDAGLGIPAERVIAQLRASRPR